MVSLVLNDVFFSVHLHSHNIGLTQQWLQIWSPKDSSSEVAFVFEDDAEVEYLKNY